MGRHSFSPKNVWVGIMLTLFATGIGAGTCLAGPPFATDDPEPTDYGHFEIYLFSEATKTANDTTGTLPGLDVNYGLLPNLQISAEIPFAFAKGDGEAAHFGYGAASFGVKYRFVEEDPDGWRPQISIFPSIEVPFDSSDRLTGGGHIREFLPVWAEKNWNDWTMFGGGGYWFNPGLGNRDYWLSGIGILHRFTSDFALGAEVFHQSADTRNSEDNSGVNVGFIYDLTDMLHLVGSAGTGIENRAATNELSYYFAIEWTP